jgi:predicted metal-binding membrane protein
MTAGLFLAALRHDRAVVLGSLALVVLLAWTYLLLRRRRPTRIYRGRRRLEPF